MARQDIKAGSAYVELLLRNQAFLRGLKSSTDRLGRFGAAVKRIGSFGMLGGGMSGLTRLFAGAGAAAALAYPVKLASNLETAEAQFTALTRSADAARQIISELEQFAPLALIPVDELQRSAQTLLGYGMAADQVVPSVQALAEISRGNAERFKLLTLAFGQTSAKTRLYAAEVRQFVESGFNPLQQIAQQTGETMKQVSARLEAGGISAQEVTAAMQAAIGPTGRFHGLLAQMGKTSAGAFARLKTGAMLAIRPLGQALLPSIKGIVESINQWMPAFAEIVKENASFALTIGAAVVGTLGFAAAITSLGLSIQITAFSLGGIVSTLGLLLNPITLVIGAVAGLAYWFATSTKWGRQMVASLAGWFTQLKDIAIEAFGGIADALAAGNLKLAAEVAMAGLNVAWLEGTDSLRKTWLDFKDVFMRTTVGMVFDAQTLWANLWAEIKKGAGTVGTSIAKEFDLTIAQIKGFFKTGEELERHNRNMVRIGQSYDGVAAELTGDIEALRQAELDKIEAARKTAQGTRDAEFNKEIEQRKKALEAAKAELAALREKAAEERKDKEQEEGPKFTPEDFEVPSLSGLKDQVFGSFSAAALAAQGAGGEPKTVKELRDLRREHKMRHRELMRAMRDGGALG